MAKQPTSQKQHLQTIKPRAAGVFGAVALGYLLLGCRLTYLQTARHTYFQQQAEKYRLSKTVLPARRGQIFDRNGEPLAINVPARLIFADPAQISSDPAHVHSIAQTASALAPLLNLPAAAIEMRLRSVSPHSHYVPLARAVPVDVAAAIKAARIPGIGSAPDTRRFYPNQTLAAQVLGFTDRDGRGIEGLESSMDGRLTGRDGTIIGEIDKNGSWLPGMQRKRVEPVNGEDLVLTLDKRLQNAAELELGKAVKEHGALSGVVVILDVATGEILAIANAPGVNPNTPRPKKHLTKAEGDALAARWRNRAVSDLYEPGSTLKTITASACLQEEGLGIMDRHVFCGGALQIGKRTIHCAADPPYYGHHGDENLRKILQESCNIGMAQFGMHLGADKLFEYEKAFGFLDKPHSGLPGEAKSTLTSPDTISKSSGNKGWAKIKLANIAFGQGVSVTPLQLTSGYQAIANDGVLMQPHIIRAGRLGQVETPVAPKIVRRVLDPEVARAVRSMLGTVVQAGTGRPAQIAGFTVGGKTGSAQVAEHGHYGSNYVASFVGMVPLSKPRVVILCSVFHPKGVHWGAVVAAPVVHNLEEQAMLQMKVTPDAPMQADYADRHAPDKAPRVRLLR